MFAAFRVGVKKGILVFYEALVFYALKQFFRVAGFMSACV